MRKWLSIVFVVLCLTWVLGSQVTPAAAAGGASDLINAVNSLRAAQGLGALKINGSLMNAAQGHSEYMASIKAATHSGGDGSTPGQRASSAGYGGRYVAENIYVGRNASAETAVSWWSSDVPHWNTMMSASSVDIGAGVAQADGDVYFTLDVGSPSGYAPAALPLSQTAGTPGTPLPTAIPILPLVTSTPVSDGSVSHQVQYGQTLITIAQAYNVSVADLKALNGLTSDQINVGQVLKIKVVPTATASPTVTLSPVPTKKPTSTRRPPTLTPTARLTSTRTATLTPTQASLLSNVRLDRQSIGIGLIVVCVLGLALVGVTAFRKSK